jgi:hypothetical protein
MESALIGLLGVLIGILINENLRRYRRIEGYADSVFKRRLEIYEELYAKIEHACPVVSDVFENSEYSCEQRQAIVSELLFEIAEFTDAHSLYLSGDVKVHCCVMLVGIEDYADIADPVAREKQIALFWKQYREAKEMIRAASGFQQFDKLFGQITKPKYQSAIADYTRQRKKQMELEGKL